MKNCGGCNIFADSLIRTHYYKYFHPKECFIGDSSINTSLNRDKVGINLVYPFGCTMNVSKPSVVAFTSGSASFPVDRPLGALHYDPASGECVREELWRRSQRLFRGPPGRRRLGSHVRRQVHRPGGQREVQRAALRLSHQFAQREVRAVRPRRHRREPAPAAVSLGFASVRRNRPPPTINKNPRGTRRTSRLGEIPPVQRRFLAKPRQRRLASLLAGGSGEENRCGYFWRSVFSPDGIFIRRRWRWICLRRYVSFIFRDGSSSSDIRCECLDRSVTPPVSDFRPPHRTRHGGVGGKAEALPDRRNKSHDFHRLHPTV